MTKGRRVTQWPNSKRRMFIKDVRETDKSIIALAAKHGIPESTGRTWAKNEGLTKGRKCQYRERGDGKPDNGLLPRSFVGSVTGEINFSEAVRLIELEGM